MNWSLVSKILGFAAAAFGLFLLYRVLSRYEFSEIRTALGELSTADLALAGLFAVVSFVALTLGERLAVAYGGHSIGLARVAKTTVAAIGIGRVVGLAALSSGAVRFRMYGRSGVDLASLGRIMLFAGLTVAVGVTSVGGIAMLVQPEAIAGLIGFSRGQTMALGGGLLAAVAVYLGLCAFDPGTIRIRKLELSLPHWRLAVGQIAAGTCNYAAISACLYACLRPFADADYPTVAALYVGADATAVIGHVPGGWGVLEYVLTSALAQPQLIAGILVFRTVYYLVPMAIGLSAFLHDEIAGLRAGRGAASERSAQAGALGGTAGPSA